MHLGEIVLNGHGSLEQRKREVMMMNLLHFIAWVIGMVFITMIVSYMIMTIVAKALFRMKGGESRDN